MTLPANRYGVSFLAARSLIELAVRPLNHLTEQAKFPFRTAGKANASRLYRSDSNSRPPRRVLCAAFLPDWPIEMGYGAELKQPR